MSMLLGNRFYVLSCTRAAGMSVQSSCSAPAEYGESGRKRWRSQPKLLLYTRKHLLQQIHEIKRWLRLPVLPLLLLLLLRWLLRLSASACLICPAMSWMFKLPVLMLVTEEVEEEKGDDDGGRSKLNMASGPLCSCVCGTWIRTSAIMPHGAL